MANITPVSEYKLCFVMNNESFKFNEPKDLILTCQTLTPSDAKLLPIVQQILESIARDYYFETNLTPKECTRVSLRFSVEKGMEILSATDERFQRIFEFNTNGVGIGISSEEAEKYQMGEVKRTIVSEENQVQGLEKFGESAVWLDMIAYNLWKNDFHGVVDVSLLVSGFEVKGPGGGVTTGFFRFPHMLRDMYERFCGERERSSFNVCIAGPGLYKPEKGLGSCPQYVELLALFPKGNFLLLERDQEAISYLHQQFNKLKCAAYDPTNYLLRTYKGMKTSYLAPKRFQPLLKMIGKEWKKMAKAPANASEILDGKSEPKLIMLNVDPKKVELRDFDFNSSQFNLDEVEKFDAIVATLSITWAVEEKPETCLDVIGKFLLTLKVNGSMYIDYPLYEVMIGMKENPEESLAYLEENIGSTLKVEEIPLSEFELGAQGNLAQIKNLTLENISNKNSFNSVSSTSIIVLTRS